MRARLLILMSFLAVILAACIAGLQYLDAQSANTLLENVRKIRPHATIDEVSQLLGSPSYTFDAPSFPPWLQKSAIGQVTEGIVLVYTIHRYHPSLLIIHLLPSSGVQFVIWEPT